LICLFLTVSRPILAQTQSEVLPPLPDFVQALNFDACIADAPAPRLRLEPRFTRGVRNVIAIELPPLSALPFPPDTVRNPIVITLVGDGQPSLKFPRPVQLAAEAPILETITALKNAVRYYYTTALFLPVCKVPCSAVADTSQLELHCSAYEDTVWSTQDAAPPSVANVVIPQLNSSPVAGWWNQSSFEIFAEASDPAGVWQAFLYRRECSHNEWNAAVSDTTFPSQLDSLGFIFAEAAQARFGQTLADGCYEFRLEAKDASHTPESFAPNFVLAGNGGQPAADAPPQIRINIDTTPPDSVTLNARQILNAIELSWNVPVDPSPGIGLAGFRIYRNGELRDQIASSENSYIDSFAVDSPTAVFTYQIQPVDSLGNVQTAGGRARIEFIGLPKITMIPEPEFTPGAQNQVCWVGSPAVDSYSVYVAENCDPAQKIKFDTADACFTFSGLQDGVAYCYWVEAVDRQMRPLLSDTVRSTQDASLPAITRLEIENPIVINGRNWLTRREVEIRLTADDPPPGRMQSIKIFENDRLVATLAPPAETGPVEMMIPITLASAECEEIALRALVEDRAGNVSAPEVFRLKLDATPPPPLGNLSASQLARANAVRLIWEAAPEAAGCSGLAGYRILRDGAEISRAHADSTGYTDVLASATPSGRIAYAVQPFDSLQNLQRAGLPVEIEYEAAPSIAVQALPEFTAGRANEICWQVVGSLVQLRLFVDGGCDGVVEQAVEIANPAAPSGCELLGGLVDGQRYCYWLAGVDAQQRTVFSDTVFSTQDATPPRIEAFAFPAGESLNGQTWAFSRTIELQIVAHDAPPGEIWRVEIIENNAPPSAFSNPDSSAQMNRRFTYTILTRETQPAAVNLQARVFDGAGNPSAEAPLRLLFQDEAPGIYAYPNPFNPIKGEITIRVSDPNEAEVKIYDFFGNLVQTLTDKENSRDFKWNGRNGDGELVANGGYICVGSRTKARFKIGVVKQN
jgi:hypothetical protein